MAGFLYWICRDFILAKNSKYEVLIISVNIFLTGFAIALITVTKGLKNIFKQQGFDITFFQSTQISFIVALAFTYVFYQFLKSKFQGGDIKSEAQFAYLMIFTSCAVAFAHGSNDVANAIGPLAAVYQASYQLIGQEYSQDTPIWILLLGAVGIVIGLATLGYRVMQTIGEKIVRLTPSKGFSAQLAAALTVIIASQLNMPVSTTHTLVGAVIGIGIIEGAGAINIKSVQTIFTSWVVTLPAGALFAIIFLEVFQNIFRY